MSTASLIVGDHRPNSRGLNILVWVVQILLAFAFFLAGSAKLSGQAMMVATFEKIGLGQWFRYLTGGVEVASAILLVIPRFTAVGALLLCATMVCAIITHIFVIGGNPTAAAVLLALSAFVAWKRLRGTG